jgi:hypothetical protein
MSVCRMLGSGTSGDILMSGSSLQMEQSAHEPTAHHHQFGAAHVYKGYGPRPSTVPSGPSLGIFWSSPALIEILVSRKCRRFRETFCTSLGAPPNCRETRLGSKVKMRTKISVWKRKGKRPLGYRSRYTEVGLIVVWEWINVAQGRIQ